MNAPRAVFNLFRTVYSHPFNRKRPFFAFYRAARWQFDKRFKRRKEYVYAFWNDRKILCFPDSLESMWLVYNYVMDWEEFAFIAHYLRPDSCAFDVGTNIGIYTLWMSRFIGSEGKIIGFEPDARNYARCSRQIELNRLNTVVVLENMALGHLDGLLPFTQGRDGENHLLLDRSAENAVQVRVETLDAYVSEKNIRQIDFIKLDVEGAEFYILKGGESCLSQGRVNVIQFELNSRHREFGLRKEAITGFLIEKGYEICRYDVKRNELISQGPNDRIPQNLFAARNREDVNRRLASGGSGAFDIRAFKP